MGDAAKSPPCNGTNPPVQDKKGSQPLLIDLQGGTWNRVSQRVSRWWSLTRSYLAQPRSRHHLTIVAGAILVLSYALSVVGYVLFTPEIGIRCAFSPVVNQFFPEFLYGDGQKPLQRGDQIIQIGDQPIKGNWSLAVQQMGDLRHIDAKPGDSASLADRNRHTAQLADGRKLVRVTYKRAGVVDSVWCVIGPPPLETLVPSVLWFLLKIGLFVVGAIVYWIRSEDRAAAQFFRLCIVSLGAYIGGYHWWRIVTEPVLLMGFMISAMVLPAVSLHFYLLFPRPKAILERHAWPVLALVYGPPILFLLLLGYDYTQIHWYTDPDLKQRLLGTMLSQIYAYFGVALVWYLLSVVCLFHSLRAAKNNTERNQVKWVLFGASAALVPIGYSLYLAFLEQERFGGGAATWPMFAASACVSLAFTIAITRYRLLQLDQILSSGFIYFLISSLVGLVYYGLVFVGMVVVGRRGGDGPSLSQALGAGAATLVLLVILDALRSRFKIVLDRHFRREKYQLDRTLLRMRQAIDQLVDPSTLAKRLLQTSADLLDISSGAVYLRHGTPPLYRLAETLGPAHWAAELSPASPVIAAATTKNWLWLRDRQRLTEAECCQLELLGGEVAQALTHEGQLLGLLVLGPKEAGFFGRDDLTVLSAFAELSVLALVSAEGHRTIETLNRDLQTKVEKIAEQQRRILILQSQLRSSAGNSELGVKTAQEKPTTQVSAGVNSELRTPNSELGNGLTGTSPQIRQVMALVKKVAASPSVVLLRGESGTGKGVLARALHDASSRASRPFVKVHCAALAPGLLESELFGHVKGAFTNALRDKPGRFETAHGGTLFLDEIGDISLDVQTKLLRVLQEMTFERVGSNEPIKVDVRIVAATHQDLEELIAPNGFERTCSIG